MPEVTTPAAIPALGTVHQLTILVRGCVGLHGWGLGDSEPDAYVVAEVVDSGKGAAPSGDVLFTAKTKRVDDQ